MWAARQLDRPDAPLWLLSQATRSDEGHVCPSMEGECQPYLVLKRQKQTVLMLYFLQSRFHCMQLLHMSKPLLGRRSWTGLV